MGSNGYKYLMNQINATGRERLDGYYPRIMEEIYEWERDEVEDIIWDGFNNKQDTDLAMFFPKLKKYDGITALKNFLSTCNIPSGNSLNVAKVLLDETNDVRYLEIFKENLKDQNSTYRLRITSMLSRCKPMPEIYELLKKIYISDPDKYVRSTASSTLLYYKGYRKDPTDIKETMKNLDLERKFMLDNEEDRKKIIEKLEKGEL